MQKGSISIAEECLGSSIVVGHTNVSICMSLTKISIFPHRYLENESLAGPNKTQTQGSVAERSKALV